SSHRPDIVNRIQRGDPSVIKRVIDNRGEEVERLDQGEIIAQTIHSGVIRFVETDQQIWIVWLSLKPAQHLSEDRRRQLGRSTRAGNHLSQTHFDFLLSTGSGFSPVSVAPRL